MNIKKYKEYEILLIDTIKTIDVIFSKITLFRKLPLELQKYDSRNKKTMVLLIKSEGFLISFQILSAFWLGEIKNFLSKEMKEDEYEDFFKTFEGFYNNDLKDFILFKKDFETYKILTDDL